MWYPNYKKQYCTAQEELFCWYIVLYPLSQFLHKNPKMIWFIILLRNTAFQILMSLSIVNFVIKSFQNFNLYVNIKTSNMAFVSRQQMVIWATSSTKLLMPILKPCQHFLVDPELKRVRHTVINYAVETLNETIMNEKLNHFFDNLKSAAKKNLVFGFILKKNEDGGFR